jgi:hypothetical protein
MGIEITSGGVAKTFRYYPYDAFYVDANGNLNTNGNGQKVMEAWFNGVKYYPEDGREAIVYKDKYSSERFEYYSYDNRDNENTFGIGTFVVKGVFVSAYDPTVFVPSYYAYGTYIESQESGDNPSGKFDLFAIISVKATWDADATGSNLDKYHVFNRNRFDARSQQLFDTLATGLTLSFSLRDFLTFFTDSDRERLAGIYAGENPYHSVNNDMLCSLEYEHVDYPSKLASRGDYEIAFRFDVDSAEYDADKVKPIYLFVYGGIPCIASSGRFASRRDYALKGRHVGGSSSKSVSFYNVFVPTTDDFLP